MSVAAGSAPVSHTQTGVRPPRSRLRKILRWLAGLLLALIAAAVALLLGKDALLRVFVQNRIRERTGFEAKIGEFKVALGSAKISVQDFKLFSPAEFGGAKLVDIPELFLELDSEQAAAGKIHFKELRFNLAELNVVKTREGGVNLAALERALATNAPVRDSRLVFTFAGIDRMTLTLGRVNFTDLGQPRNSQTFLIGVTNEVVTTLRTEDELRAWAASFVVRVAVQELLAHSARPKGFGLKKLLEAFGL